MFRCVRCGTQNLASAQFCDECGVRLQAGKIAAQPEMWRTGRSLNHHEKSESRVDSEPNFKSNDFDKQLKSTAQSVRGGSTAPDLNREIADKTNAAHSRAAENDSEPLTAPRARLVVERGKNAGKEFALNQNEINIGRWDADNGIFPDVDLDTDDPEAKVSRRHARIVRRLDQYLIEDLGSTNGTFVNRGRRLIFGNQQILSDGDEIIVGKTFLRFSIIER